VFFSFQLAKFLDGHWSVPWNDPVAKVVCLAHPYFPDGVPFRWEVVFRCKTLAEAEHCKFDFCLIELR